MNVPDKTAVREILDKVRAQDRGALTAPEGKRICDAYGIPTPAEGLATTAEEAAALAEEIGGPGACKILSPDILHKTEAGGVVVGVEGGHAVREAFNKIIANVRSYDASASITGV